MSVFKNVTGFYKVSIHKIGVGWGEACYGRWVAPTHPSFEIRFIEKSWLRRANKIYVDTPVAKRTRRSVSLHIHHLRLGLLRRHGCIASIYAVAPVAQRTRRSACLPACWGNGDYFRAQHAAPLRSRSLNLGLCEESHAQGDPWVAPTPL
jgi:hypothetical protein